MKIFKIPLLIITTYIATIGCNTSKNTTITGDVKTEFIESLLDEMINCDSPARQLKKYIAPTYYNAETEEIKDFSIEYFAITGYKIVKYDKQNALISVNIWDGNQTFKHELTFKVIENQNKWYALPGGYDKNNKRIYPWYMIKRNVE